MNSQHPTSSEKHYPAHPTISDQVLRPFLKMQIHWQRYALPEECGNANMSLQRFFNTIPPDDTLAPCGYISQAGPPPPALIPTPTGMVRPTVRDPGYLPLSLLRLPGSTMAATQLPLHPLLAWASIVVSGARSVVNLVEPGVPGADTYMHPKSGSSATVARVAGSPVAVVFDSVVQAPRAAQGLAAGLAVTTVAFSVTHGGAAAGRGVVKLLHFREWQDYTAIGVRELTELVALVSQATEEAAEAAGDVKFPSDKNLDVDGRINAVITWLNSEAARKPWLQRPPQPQAPAAAPVPPDAHSWHHEACDAAAEYVLGPGHTRAGELAAALAAAAAAVGGRMLVHCRAGVGRTGTLLSASFYYQLLQLRLYVNIPGDRVPGDALVPVRVIQLLRRYRGRYTVQRIEQYLLIVQYFASLFSLPEDRASDLLTSTPPLLPSLLPPVDGEVNATNVISSYL